MKKTNFLSMLAVLMFALTAISCSNEKEQGPDLTGFNDYFISVSVSGGGWNNADMKNFETELYLDLMELDEELEGVRMDYAVEVFDYVVDGFKYEWRNGASDVSEPLYVDFFLKTVVEGYVVKSRVVTINPAKNNAPEERVDVALLAK